MLKKLFFATVLACLLNFSANGQTTIPVSISMDTIRACQENVITARFRGSGSNKIRINSHLLNVSNGISCGTSNGLLLEFISLIDSAGGSISHSALIVDTANGGMSFNVSTTDTCVLKYKIRVDCSLIQTSNVNNQIYLVHHWADSSSAIIYNLNGSSADSVVNYHVIYPILQNITNLIDSVGYKEHVGLEFAFLNSGTDSGKIAFQLFTDTSNYCNAFTQDSLRFKINANGVPASYVNGSFQNINLAVDDTLIITQYVTSNTCMNDTCHPQVRFAWRCSYSDSLGTAFCDTCFGSSPVSYFLNDRSNPVLNITRTIPVTDQDANFSLRCVNDTTDMQLWEFLITTTGKGKLDSIVINLDNFIGGTFNSLGLIPESTIEVDTLCTDCSVQLITTSNTTALCRTYVSDPVDKIQVLLRVFGEKDTARIRFKTFRCVEFDTSLYNESKYYSTWKLENSYSRGICGNLNSTAVIHPSYVRSGINAGIGSSVNLPLVYTPTVTDLSVPPLQIWGDTGSFKVNLDGLFYQGFEAQLSGCSYLDSTCIPNGYMRVSIDVDSGLKVVNVDSMISFRYKDSLNLDHYYKPFYYYYNGPASNCEPDTFRYYFSLSDSNAFKILKEGQFKFFLQACCGGQNGERKYKVRFDLFIDPTGVCDTVLFNSPGTGPPTCGSHECPWLPLSFVEGDIDIHCPGCRTPGIVVNSYRIERTSFGLQDSDNDGFADGSGIPIDRNSTWYRDNKQDLGWMNSGFGDKVEDFLVAEFSAGVPYLYNGKVGYSYAQMNQNGAWFHYLQLSRKMPHALDTMSVIPDSIILYIDTPDSASNPDSCLDCGLFPINPTVYHTQRKLRFTGSSIQDVLHMDTISNEYFYTFSSFDSIPQYGVLHNPAYIVWSSTQRPYTGFFEGQKYRLRVYYSITGNFMLPQGYAATPEIDQVRAMSEIENAMWFSGDSLPQNAFSSIGKNPGDTIELHQKNWFIPNDSVPGAIAINQTFADSFAFNCENCGGIFYYYSHGVSNNSQIAKLDTCNYQINATAISNTGGNITIVYPYEYHPANLQPRSFTITVPPGYVIVGARYRNTVYDKDGLPVTSSFVGFTPPANSGTFTIHDSLYNKSQCLLEGDIITDSIQYYSNRQTIREYLFEITPTDCDSLKFYQDSALVFVSFEGDVGHCFIPNKSAADSSVVQHTMRSIYPFGIRPNIQISPVPSVTLTSNQVCFRLNISNPDSLFADTLWSTAAPNFYISIPSVNWLSNWSYHSGGVTLSLNPDSLFLVDDLLGIGEVHQNDTICATITNCTKDTSIQFKAGWSCSGYPADPDSGCGLLTFSYDIIRDSVLLNVMDPINQLVPAPPVSYSLCDTLFYGRCFKSSGNGYLYPDFVRLYDIPPALGIACVHLRKDACQGNPGNVVVSLDYDTMTGTWPVTAANMIALGFADSALHINEGINVEIGVMPDCHFSGNSLPDFDFNVTSYCGDTITRTYAFTDSLAWDGTSQCHDCFSITKTLLDNLVAVGDTITYHITVSANNGVLWSAVLTDITPPGFVITNPIPPYIIVPAQGDTSFFLQGYFTTTGSCPQMQNTAYLAYADFDSLNHVTSNVDSISDTACVVVLHGCITDSTILFPDSTLSDTLEASYDYLSIFIEGTFIMNTSISFNYCTVYMAPGAQIILNGTNQLNLYYSSMIACDTMWQGISITGRGTVNLEDSSLIADAHEAIYTGSGGNVRIINSSLLNNNTGVLVPDQYPSIFSGSLYLNGANFGMNASFKPDYAHQPAHGPKPFAGIVLHDVSLNLGANYTSKNCFFNMNNGIRAYRSNLKVYNSNFMDIQIVPFYNNGTNQNGSAISIVGDNESEQAAPSSLTLWPNPDGSPNVSKSRCGVYAAITYTEIFGCLFDTLDYGIDEQFLDIGLQSYLLYNTIRAKRYGIRLMENNGSDYISIEGNIITMLNLEKSAVGIYMGESNLHHSNNYNVNSNGVYIYNATSGIQTAGVSNANITYNTVELRTPLSYTAPSTTGIDIGGGAGNFLSCNHVSGHQVTDSLRYGYRVTQSPFDSLKCNVADSVGYSFRFEGAACLGTRLKGNYMGNAYCGLYLNSEAITGQQPQGGSPPYHGNVWLDTARYVSGYGAVNLNDASPLTLQASLFTTNNTISVHNPKIPGNTNPPPFYVNDAQWFDRVPSGSSFDCSRSNVCIAAIQDSGDWGDDQFRLLVVNDSNVTSIFIPESKQIASQLIYADLKTDPNTLSVSAYSDFLNEKESLSEGVIYRIDSVGTEIKTMQAVRNDSISGLIDQIKIFADSISIIDSLIYLTNDSTLIINKEELLFRIFEIKEAISQIQEINSLNLSNKLFVNELLNNQLASQQIPDANYKEVERINLLFKQNGVSAISENYESLIQIAIQCPSAGGPAVFKARTLVLLVNDSITYDDVKACVQLGILRMSNNSVSSTKKHSFIVSPNPASTEVYFYLDQLQLENYTLKVINNMGAIIFQSEYKSILNSMSLSILNYPQGVYTIQLKPEAGEIMTEKLVIIR